MWNDNKRCYERFAKDILSNFVNEKYESYILVDKPDIQCKSDSVGIEVVRSIPTKEGKARNFCNKYFKSFYTDKFICEKKEKMKLPGKFYTRDQYGFRGYTLGMHDFNSRLKLITDRINGKVIKFKSYEPEFISKRLFVFCDWPIEENNINDILIKINDLTYFDEIYFECRIWLYIFNSNEKSLRCITFNANLYKKLIQKCFLNIF